MLPDMSGVGRMGEKGEGSKKYKLVVADSHGGVKYSMGSRGAEEHTCMTHGQW